MNAESGNGSSGSVVWGVIAGIVVVVGAGGLFLSRMGADAPEEPAPQVEVAVQSTEDDTPDEPVAQEPEAEAPAAEASTAEQEDTAEAAPPVTPSLDQIFVEPDGNAVLSGSAEPGAEVNVLLDGEPVHSFTVDPSGQFAEFLSIPFADTARGLTLQTQGDEPVRSDDYVIAALPEPEPVAEPTAPAETAENETTQPENAETENVAAAETADVAEPIETTDAPEPGETADVSESEAEAEQSAQAAGEDAQAQGVAILRSGEDGVELVQAPTAQPKEPDQVALDTIGYSDAGDVELTGRVPDGSVVRLYLDNRLVDDLTPADDGKWRSELDGIEPGVYTLRVDEVGADGTVMSRLETPFKREPQEVLRAAEATDEPELDPDTPPIRSVTVQEGDTLWAISRERFGDGVLYVRLFEANRDSIRDPDLIYPGQIFTIPE
ncbi:LysM peptidoglycan-binding domain-containing protein [Ruegeria arenilitoris]|uniref:LysM peptidoglycan-binding domain-containing protein n=1 Tax=Ruegeria arenilitoris TaxID=1173585 RepID=UPI001480DB4C|nr:LysM peptidoglycan-binding domain-containing protein [Ruegeria arenilitoris]